MAAMSAPTVHCVMSLVRGRELFSRITVSKCWIRVY